ncbi:hypothetical protein ABEY43_07235 [Priestia megaterium]
MTKFYNFSQCNSGGYFEVDDNVCEEVIVEANTYEQANEIAKTIGIYFYGSSTGEDCSCCGDRWREVDEDDGENEPMIGSTLAREYKRGTFRDQCYIYYLNGTKEVIEFEDKNGKKKHPPYKVVQYEDNYNVYNSRTDELVYCGNGEGVEIRNSSENGIEFIVKGFRINL